MNGVLIPGGGASFYADDGYAKAGAMIYKIAKEVSYRELDIWQSLLKIEFFFLHFINSF